MASENERDMEALNPSHKDEVKILGKWYKLERLTIEDQIKMARLERRVGNLSMLTDDELLEVSDEIKEMIKALIPSLPQKKIDKLRFEIEFQDIMDTIEERSLRDQGLSKKEITEVKDAKKKLLRMRLLESVKIIDEEMETEI